MKRQSLWAFLLAWPLGLAAVGCGGEDPERLAREQDIADRELELALERDGITPTFEDSALAPQPAPRAPAEAPPTRSQPAPKPAKRSDGPPPEPRPVTLVVPVGTTFAVRLNETLSTEQNQVGDPFTATLADPIVDLNGRVLLPSGAVVRGRVTGAEKSGRVGETAVLTLAFETVSFEGRSYPLQATVIEANPERKTRTSKTQTAGKIAAGAAAGAIVGQVLGKNTESTIKGAVVGAAAGTAIALGTADVDAVLPSGSRMVIRLDGPVEVQRVVE